MDWEKLEREFIAEGWGNGSLHPYVVHDPINYWQGGNHKDDFYVGFDFHQDDWKTLFFEALGCPEVDWPNSYSYEQFYQHARSIFGQALPEYPMLSRICDMYEDAVYEAREVNQLREECLKAQGFTNHASATKALNKLILACNKASEPRLGLRLISD